MYVQVEINHPITFYDRGRVLKFGLREFTLITNMNYNEILDVNTEDIKGGGRLQRIYFETLKSVTKHI